MANMFQHNHVGIIKDTVTLVFENGYSLVFEKGTEISMNITTCHGFHGTSNTDGAELEEHTK